MHFVLPHFLFVFKLHTHTHTQFFYMHSELKNLVWVFNMQLNFLSKFIKIWAARGLFHISFVYIWNNMGELNHSDTFFQSGYNRLQRQNLKGGLKIGANEVNAYPGVLDTCYGWAQTFMSFLTEMVFHFVLFIDSDQGWYWTSMHQYSHRCCL